MWLLKSEDDGFMWKDDRVNVHIKKKKKLEQKPCNKVYFAQDQAFNTGY
jgi:hypothetical protein